MTTLSPENTDCQGQRGRGSSIAKEGGSYFFILRRQRVNLGVGVADFYSQHATRPCVSLVRMLVVLAKPH